MTQVHEGEARNPTPDEVRCFKEAVTEQDSSRLITVIIACPGVAWSDTIAEFTKDEQGWIARVWASREKEESSIDDEPYFDGFSDEGYEGGEATYEP
jgi:hypothetical protein